MGKVGRIAIVAAMLALASCAAARPREAAEPLRQPRAVPERLVVPPAKVVRRTPSSKITDGYGLPSSTSWVCEVEASQKVFTGIGANQEEASLAAHATCSSHLQASYCRKTECKKNL